MVLHTDFKSESDVLTLDIRSAYPVPELTKLERTFVYRREANPSLSVSDDVAFDKAESFESALITWGKMQSISTNEFAIRRCGSGPRQSGLRRVAVCHSLRRD